MKFLIAILVAIVVSIDAFRLNSRMTSSYRSSLSMMASPGETVSDSKAPMQVIKDGVMKAANSIALGSTALGVATIASSLAPQPAFAKDPKVWEKVDLGTKETLFDISFDPSKPEHGWIVGAKGSFLETFDGGATWKTRTFNSLDEDEDINYRFEVTALAENEGWIIGKPALLLHTKDGGKQFERIPLSPKLPGEPTSISFTGLQKAEMITSQGAIYTTENGGLNWKAQVKETIDATLNRVSSSGTSGASFFTGKITNQIRDKNGNYLAVASRGNLFLTWQPGDDYWVPHNRGSPKRIQNMGFIGNDAKNGIWMSLNGGSLLKTKPNPDLSQVDLENLFEPCKINSGGYGIIDVCWKDEKTAWAVGGSGVIFKSEDGGNTFKFVSDAKDIPGNLYRVKFFGDDKGYALGSDGVLLKYVGKA